MDCLSRDCEPARRAKIGVARAWVAARMIVREQDCRAAVLRRVDYDVAQRQADGGNIADVTREVEAAALGVDVGYP